MGLTAGACGRQPVPSGHRSWREIAAVLRKDRRFHASTAHPPQQSDLSSPPRLPGAAGAVQGGVGPVVGGDRPSPRCPPRDDTALEEGSRPPQHAEHDGAGGPSQTPGPRPPVHRLGSLRSDERPAATGAGKRKKGVTHDRASPHPHPSPRRCLTGAAASS